MKKMVAILGIFLATFNAHPASSHTTSNTVTKKAKIVGRVIETAAGLAIGLYSLSKFELGFLKDIHLVGGVHFSLKNYTPRMTPHVSIISQNQGLAGLLLAYFLVHDGLVNLNKEYKYR